MWGDILMLEAEKRPHCTVRDVVISKLKENILAVYNQKNVVQLYTVDIKSFEVSF